jgi:HptB-dependent secretion and biofilm anti anti-sigma factor
MSTHNNEEEEEEHNQQNLAKMSQEELISAVDKDFNTIWNSKDNALDKDNVTKQNSKYPLSKIEDRTYLITVTSLTFSSKCQEYLHNLYNELPKGEKYILDFAKVKYIDSTGMGVLLMLREHHGNFELPIKIINCRDTVLGLLKLAQFGKIFELS